MTGPAATAPTIPWRSTPRHSQARSRRRSASNATWAMTPGRLAAPVYMRIEGMPGVVPDTTIRPRWWQWPTVLSLDAAVIAMAWQTLMAGALGVPIGWPAVFVLGSSVWLAYTCDRWIEAWRLGDRPLLTPRHRFHQRHRGALAAVAALVLAADVGVAFAYLDRRDITAGLILTVAVLAYLLSHQWVHR